MMKIKGKDFIKYILCLIVLDWFKLFLYIIFELKISQQRECWLKNVILFSFDWNFIINLKLQTKMLQNYSDTYQRKLQMINKKSWHFEKPYNIYMLYFDLKANYSLNNLHRQNLVTRLSSKLLIVARKNFTNVQFECSCSFKK